MIGKKLTRGRNAERPFPRGGAGKRCYVIGDVHGRLDLLDQLLDAVVRHNATRAPRDVVIVFLGDLIDRGPDSRGVIERLRRPPPLGRYVFVKGNHEEILLRGLKGEPDQLQSWLENGGVECARSYGVEPGALMGHASDVVEHVIASAIPRSHLAFLEGFVDSVRFGDYLFVHAGVRPGVPLEEQAPTDLRWIRAEFLDSAADHGFVVIHGHSIVLEIEERPNRIGVDTGAYRTGVLTALWIEDDQRGYLKAVGSAEPSAPLV